MKRSPPYVRLASNYFLFGFLSLLLLSCSQFEQEDAAIKASLQVVKDQYAPDRRVAVFDLQWERHGNALVVKGEVDNLSAKNEALAAIVGCAAGEVIDSVRVLPDSALETKRYGIVIVSVANMRGKPAELMAGKPDQSAELSTQVLMGMVVKLLKKHKGWYYVQSHDRYLGWLEGDAIQGRKC